MIKKYLINPDVQLVSSNVESSLYLKAKELMKKDKITFRQLVEAALRQYIDESTKTKKNTR